MRTFLASVILCALAACGSNSSTSTADGPPGDGNGTGAPDAPNGGGNVTVTLTNQPGTPATFDFIVAYQDGDGAWKVAPAPSGDTYTLPIASGRYGVAWTCSATAGGVGGGAFRLVDLTYFTVAERPSLTMTIPNRCTDRASVTPVTITGTISNRPAAGGRLSVALGSGRPAFVSATTGTYSIDVAPGTYDLIVTHSPATGGGGPGGGGDVVVDQAFVQRGLAVTAAATQDVDFSKASATQTFPVTVTGNGTASTSTTLYAGGTVATLVRDATTPFETNALATADGKSTDVYLQSITVAGAGQSATTESATATPAAETYAAPAALGGAIATVGAATPYPQIKTTWTAYANAIGYNWAVTQALTGTACGTGTAACAVDWTATISNGWLGTAGSYQMPDLSAVTGWNAIFQPATGTMITGAVEAETSSAGASDFPFGAPAAGTTRTRASSDFTVTP